MKNILSKSFVAAFASALFVLFLYYQNQNITFFEELENRALSLMYRIRGPAVHDQRIAIIAIDEKSLKELGRWPWPRQYWAEFLSAINKSNPSLLFIDVWFSEHQSPGADLALEKAFKQSHNVLLPIVFELDNPTSHAEISRWAVKVNQNGLLSTAQEPKGVIASIPQFASATKGSGHINVFSDSDGVIRWTPLVIKYRENYYPSLALAAAKEATGAKDIVAEGEDRIKLGDITVQTDENLRMLINYKGPERTYTYYSFADVMRGRVAKSSLTGKFLLVGTTAQGIYDMRVTPVFPSNMPGVEVNANIIDNILHQDSLLRGPLQQLSDIFFIIAAGIIMGLIIPRMKAAFAFPFAAALLLGYGYLAVYLFTRGYWLSTLYPSLSIILSYLSATVVLLFIGEKKIVTIKRIFSNYVSKEVVDELIKHPEKAKLGGELKDITIIFCDLKGFTGYNERHSPGEVVTMLNEYFEAMTECIIKYNGTLDKFLGDGIMAFWNAPLDQPNHPELAVRCALDMLVRFEGLRGKWKSESRELFDFGIGINSGEVIIGNIGVYGRKMDYTIIGDSVNITSRLLEQTRAFNRKIIITKIFFNRVKDIIDAEELGNIILKGKEEPVSLLAVVGLKKP